MSTIAIDFDGVIHRYSKGWQEGEIYDTPIEGAKEAIQELIKKYKVVILTARKDIRGVNEWLNKYDFPRLEVTNIKPPAIAYIDDKGVRFTNWHDIKSYFIEV